MRKTFPLADPPHKPAQVVAAIKNKIRKYLKRERRKVLPEDVDYWDFDCQVGQDGPTKVVHIAQLIASIDEAADNGWPTVYVEILAKPGKRTPKPSPSANNQSVPSAPGSSAPDAPDSEHTDASPSTDRAQDGDE